MKEENSIQNSKKIRNNLIYYTYLELKKKQNSNRENYLLINSMTPNDLNNKYQKCSDYCVEKIETYTHMNGMSNNNNYCHVSVTYCSLNNNYHMLIDNSNVAKDIGENNIVGKYYKGDTIQIGTTSDKNKYKININKNKFEKNIIGEKKMIKPHRNIFSSLEITKNINFMKNENNNEIYKEVDNLKSNNNEENQKKFIKDKLNNGMLQTNCGIKIRKSSTLKNWNKYMAKLKHYCSNLIKLERRGIKVHYSKKNTSKDIDLSSPKRKKNEKSHFKALKEKSKYDKSQTTTNRGVFNSTNFTGFLQCNFNQKLINSERNAPIQSKLKSQTKIHQNLFQTKNSLKIHKNIDKIEEKVASYSTKKINSPKKGSSPRKINSPKKGNTNDFNSGNGFPTSKFFQKMNKKEKSNENVIKKNITGNKMDLFINKRKANIINPHTKLSSIDEKGTANPNIFRTAISGNITKKGRLKKSLTINKMNKFRAGEILEKKISNIKIKDNKY